MIVSSPSHQAYLSACVSVSAAERRWPLKPPWCPPRLFSPSDLEVLLDLTDFHSHTRTAGERATSGRRKKKKTTTLEASQEEKKNQSSGPNFPFISTPGKWAVRPSERSGSETCVSVVSFEFWRAPFTAPPPPPPPWSLPCNSYFVPVKHRDEWSSGEASLNGTTAPSLHREGEIGGRERARTGDNAFLLTGSLLKYISCWEMRGESHAASTTLRKSSGHLRASSTGSV